MISFPFTLMAGGSAAPSVPEAQVYESFTGYALAPLVGQSAMGSGLQGAWQTEQPGVSFEVATNGLSFGTLRIQPQSGARGIEAGARTNWIALTPEAQALLHNPTPGTRTVFVSMLFQSSTLLSDRRMALTLGKFSGGAHRNVAFLWLYADDPGGPVGSFGVAVEAARQYAPGALVADQTALYLARIDVHWNGTVQTLDVSMNQYTGGSLPTEEPQARQVSLSGVLPYGAYANDPITRLALVAEWSNIPAFRFDELRLSDSFQRVVPTA